MTGDRARRVLPLLGTLLVIAVSAAANTVTINGYRTGQISDLYPTGFTPAGWVFSIWSVIYVGLLAYAGSQIAGPRDVVERGASVRSLFLVNAVANAAWIFAWHMRSIGLSFAIMLVILGTLVAIDVRLRKLPRPSRAQRFLVDGPFSLYFGWITTATIANFGALLFAVGSYPFHLTMNQWALVSVVAAIVLYVAMGLTRRDVVYCGVFVWASLGIFLKHGGVSAPVRTAAITGTGLVLTTILAITVVGRRL